MERIGILGLGLGEADVGSLERLAEPVASAGDAAWRALADELAASELVVLCTCNRLELCFARESGDLPGPGDARAAVEALQLPSELAATLRFHGGRAAVRHLFRVASSLDSLVVGEDQILAQVRAAFAESERLGLAGRLLSTVFEHAFQVGKQVRTHTELGRRPLSVVGVGVAALVERLTPCPDAPGNARGRAPGGARGGARVAVVGAGEMGSLAARALAAAGLGPALVANRSPAAAQRLAELHGAIAVPLERFQAGEHPVDALVSATSAPGPVLDASTLAALAARAPAGRGLVAVDLALPRDLEPPLPRAGRAPVEVLDLEALRGRARENRERRRGAARAAEELVEAKVETLARRFSEHRLAAAISELRSESSAILERELARLRQGPFVRLDDGAREAVERWARSAFGRMAHAPISAMRQLAWELSSASEPDAGPVEDGEPAADPREVRP